ncbi:TrmH family RNA methyltransferase [candidate division KSB1 bacterium]|nr:TrmH family RNA methyltransferase [candidate division KSB1 bacterium]
MSHSEFYTVVENVRSLYNVGAIFRTADGVGVSKLFLTGISGQPPQREIRKVALGAEEAVPWKYYPKSEDIIRKLKQQGVQIVVLESTRNSIPYHEADYAFPLCLVVGHEYEGVSEQTLRDADLVIDIPMKGSKVSLNVAVAYGIAVYEIVKAQSQL